MSILDISGTRQIPFTRLVQVELRKMADTRAGRWLLIVIGVLTVLAVGLLIGFGESEELDFGTLLEVTVAPQGFLLPVLGVLLVTSEWGQRSHLITFTLVPHRGAILGAKVVAAVLFGLAAIALAVVVAAVAALLFGGDDPFDGFGADLVGKLALAQSLGVLQGLAFGLLFLNSAAAIVAFFVVPIGFSILTGLVDRIRELQPWIDTATAQGALFEPTSVTGEQWAQLLTSSLLWIALPAAIGTWRVLRAEVK